MENEQTSAASGRMTATETRACVGRMPSRPDRGSDVAVRFQVVLDKREPDGRVVLYYPMAPQRRRRAQAERDLRTVREYYPAAHLSMVRYEAAAFEAFETRAAGGAA